MPFAFTKTAGFGILASAVTLISPLSACAATYYVDFVAGDDARAGQSEKDAWKHAPGDPLARENAASTILAGGDIVQFRGGIVYRGTIQVPASGEEGNRIIYRGTGWEKGRAIVDGSDLITGWKKCESAADAGGNPKFENLYFAEIESASPFLLNLHELDSQKGADEFLDVAQDPNPADSFFFDRKDFFYPVTNQNLTTTTIIAPEVFTQTDPDHWKGASVLLWVNPNFTKRYKILGFDPGQHRITIEDITSSSIYPDKRDQSFAIYNSPHVIDRAGEYFVSEADAQGKRRIILWPRSPENLDERISGSRRKHGFELRGLSQVEIDGFEVRKFSGESLDGGSGIVALNEGPAGGRGLLIRNNFVNHNLSAARGYGGIHFSGVTDSKIENNEITWNKSHRGMFCSRVENVIIRGNRVSHNGSTGIALYTGKRTQIVNNDIADSFATHANGITVYIASENVLVAGNRITESTNPITFQDSGPLYFINNFTEGGDLYKNVNEWPNTRRGPWASGQIVFLNNTFVNAEKESSLTLGSDPEKSYVFINNILDGVVANSQKSASQIHRHNIFTGQNNFQTSRYGWQAGEGESNEDNPAGLFVDAEKKNFALRPGGPAIGTGVEVGEYYPKDIFPEVDFKVLAGETRPMNIGATIPERRLP